MEGLENFACKCTYTKQDENEEKETSKFKKGKPKNKKKHYGKKKIVYTMDYNEYSDGSEVEETKVLFMGLDTQASNSDSNVEWEIDIRAELVSALEEIQKCRCCRCNIFPKIFLIFFGPPWKY